MESNKEVSILDILKFDNPSTGIGSIRQLKTLLLMDPYRIEFKEKGEYVLLAYSQIDSDPRYKMVRECRGLIIHIPTNKIVCRSFDRFPNAGEDWGIRAPNPNTLKFSSKEDGSLIRLWYHNNGWHISTRGMIDIADATVSGTTKTFADLFFDTTAQMNCLYDLNELDKNSTH